MGPRNGDVRRQIYKDYTIRRDPFVSIIISLKSLNFFENTIFTLFGVIEK